MNFRFNNFTRCLARILLGLTLLPELSVRGQTNTPTLTVMTYNLRYASPAGPNAWPQRRPLVREVITANAPDVMGTQEGLYEQLRELSADLPGYDWLGLGRNGGSRGEFSALFYRKDRLEPLEFDHFWLSETPDVMGSKHWAELTRMVTWVKFRDRLSGQEFYVFNTHFDHQFQVAREKSAALVRERVAALKTKLPVLLIGDFNATAGANKAYDILTADDFFVDTWKTAPRRIGEGLNSFNGFGPIKRNGERIDWILSRGQVAVDQIKIDTFERDGQFPSDHFPVVAKLRLGGADPH